MSAAIDAVMNELFDTLRELPDGDRAYAGGRLIAIAQEILGPVYWPITLETLVQLDLDGPSAARPTSAIQTGQRETAGPSLCRASSPFHGARPRTEIQVG